MSTTPNDNQHTKHLDRPIETPVYQNNTVAQWHRERIISRLEADVLDIILRFDGTDESGVPCSV